MASRAKWGRGGMSTRPTSLSLHCPLSTVYYEIIVYITSYPIFLLYPLFTQNASFSFTSFGPDEHEYFFLYSIFCLTIRYHSYINALRYTKDETNTLVMSTRKITVNFSWLLSEINVFRSILIVN